MSFNEKSQNTSLDQRSQNTGYDPNYQLIFDEDSDVDDHKRILSRRQESMPCRCKIEDIVWSEPKIVGDKLRDQLWKLAKKVIEANTFNGM